MKVHIALVLLGLALLGLVACGGPSPHFRGVTAHRIEVDGSVFDVRVKGDLAEAVRTNPQYAPRFGPIRQRAAFAMAKVSGCRVLDVQGDQAMAVGRLSCGPSTSGQVVIVPGSSYSCLDVAQWATGADGRLYSEFDCDPY